jgi:hypothetical protein
MAVRHRSVLVAIWQVETISACYQASRLREGKLPSPNMKRT